LFFGVHTEIPRHVAYGTTIAAVENKHSFAATFADNLENHVICNNTRGHEVAWNNDFV
jgi:hypothetical protein